MASTVYAGAKTCVFWDVEDCPVPGGVNLSVISQNIRLALGKMGYLGQVSINAYADDTSEIQIDDFESAGIKLKLVPENVMRGYGKPQSRCSALCMDMMLCSFVNPEPTNVLGITDYVADSTIDTLIMSNCNILLALPEHAAGHQIIDNVTSVWTWDSLSLGGDPIHEPAISPCCRTFQGATPTCLPKSEQDS